MEQDYTIQMDTIIDLEKQLNQVSAQAHELRSSDPLRAAQMCEEAIALAIPHTSGSRAYLNLLAHLRITLSQIYIQLAKYHKAMLQAVEAQALYENIKHTFGIASSFNAIGTAQIYLGNFPEALEDLLKSLEITDLASDDRLKSNVLNNLGYLYIRMEEHERALPFLEEGLELCEQNKNLEWHGDLLGNLCIAFYHLGDSENALKYGLESAEMYKTAQNHYGVPRAFNSVGQVYQEMGDYQQAATYFQTSLQLSEEIPHPSEIVESLYLLGKLKQSRGQPDEAIEYLSRALKKAKEIDLNQKVYRCHRFLAAEYQNIGEHEKAFFHFQRFHLTKEEVLNDRADQKLKSLEIAHQVSEAKKDAEIYRLKTAALQNEIEERKKAQTKLEELAAVDSLTGLLNRRRFFELAQEELARARHLRSSLSVIMLDIDHFKQVNDNYGHLAGDQVLIEVAKRISGSLRRVDIVCRYGGEEFAIILPETNLLLAEQVADRIWSKITSNPFKVGKSEIQVGVSLGVAYQDSEEEIFIDTLLDLADQALYKAKNAGRNQVKSYSKSLSE